MARTETIKFNVGGEIHEVPRSLLHNFPETMLAKSASEKWQEGQEDQDSDIFIDRDKTLFRYVLEYMRVGKVLLPITETKQSLLEEFKYFGIEVKEENIDDKRAQLEYYPFHLATSLRPLLKDIVEGLKVSIENSDAKIKGERLALFCVNQFFAQQHCDLFSPVPRPGTNIKIKTTRTDEEELLKNCMNIEMKVLATVNEHLRCVGLRVKGISGNSVNAMVIPIGHD